MKSAFIPPAQFVLPVMCANQTLEFEVNIWGTSLRDVCLPMLSSWVGKNHWTGVPLIDVGMTVDADGVRSLVKKLLCSPWQRRWIRHPHDVVGDGGVESNKGVAQQFLSYHIWTRQRVQLQAEFMPFSDLLNSGALKILVESGTS